MFSNRKVVFNNELSDEYNVNSGLFQGGIISPSFFFIYAHDLPQNITSIIKQFADDTNLIRVITNIQDCEALQNDIIKISEWSVETGIGINHEKTKHLKVSLKNCDSLIKYNINGVVINEFNEVNHLGIIMDKKLQFNSNCNQIL
jgi:hypothetical protein